MRIQTSGQLIEPGDFVRDFVPPGIFRFPACTDRPLGGPACRSQGAALALEPTSPQGSPSSAALRNHNPV